MLSFSKAKVGRHWASKFDLLIPDLTCFQCQAPSQNFQTNVTTTTKTIRMGTCLKKEYMCPKKSSWILGYTIQNANIGIMKKICQDLRPITKHSESTSDLLIHLPGSGAITKYWKYRYIYLYLRPIPWDSDVLSPALSRTCVSRLDLFL